MECKTADGLVNAWKTNWGRVRVVGVFAFPVGVFMACDFAVRWFEKSILKKIMMLETPFSFELRIVQKDAEKVVDESEKKWLLEYQCKLFNKMIKDVEEFAQKEIDEKMKVVNPHVLITRYEMY